MGKKTELEEREKIFMDCMELNRLYPITEDFTFAPFLVNADPYMTIALPTEVVVYEARIVTPRLARVYMMSGQVSNLLEMLITTKRAEAERRKLGKKWSRQDVLLVEVWEDYGDDGHVAFDLVGWRPVTERIFRLERKAAEWAYKQHNMYVLPNCMCPNYIP